MTRALPLLLSILLIAATASAQYNPYWRWAIADTTGAQQSGGIRHVAAAANSKAFWGRLKQIHLQSGTAALGDYALSEHDSNGIKTIGASLLGKITLLDAHADASGNWYVLGSYYDSLRLTNGILYQRSTSGTEPDHFLVRFNSGSLSTAWVMMIGGSSDATAGCFTIASNKIYLPVDSGSGTQIRSVSLQSGQSTLLFTQGGRSLTTSIAADAGGSIMLAGSCAFNGINFNGVQQNPVSGIQYPAYLVRYTATGVHRWHQWLEDITCVRRQVLAAPGNIIYYTGALRNGFTFGTQTLHGPAFVYDFVAARLDTNGNVAWVRQIDTAGGGDASLDGTHLAVVTPDTSLNIFTQTRNFIDWRDNVSTAANQYYNAAVVSFGKDGHTRWARLIKGDFTGNEDIVTDGSDAVWVTGSGYTSLNYLLFDTAHLYLQPLSYNPYLAKLKLTPKPPTGITFAGADMGLRVFPNPAINVLHISFSSIPANAMMALRDITGRIILQQSVTEKESVMDVHSFAKGLYFLELKAAGARQAERIVLQ